MVNCHIKEKNMDILEQLREKQIAYLTSHLLVLEATGAVSKAKHVRDELNELKGAQAKLEVLEEEKGMLESDM